MSFETDRENITQFFINNLTGINLRFEGFDYPNQEPPFVGVIISPLVRANDTIDSLTQPIDGVIRVRVFTQRNNGTKESLELCDQVAAIIDNQLFNNIITFAADVPNELNTEDNYLAKEITIPYQSN